MHMIEVIKKQEAQRRRRDLALIKVSEEAAITVGWMHGIGRAGRGDHGSRYLRKLENALNELYETVK